MVLLMAPTTDTHATFDRYVMPELDVLYRTAWSLTRSDADAQDLVQETLLRAFRAIDRFDGRYPRAWLLTIMRNANINRARKKRPELLDDPDATFERSTEFAETTGPEDLALHAEFDATVEEGFLNLPDRFREVVELVDLDGARLRRGSRGPRGARRHGDEPAAPSPTPDPRPHRSRRPRCGAHRARRRNRQHGKGALMFGRLFRRNMTCADVLDVLQSYIDGETDEDTARKVLAHLDACPPCERQSAVFIRIKASLSRRSKPIDPEVMQALTSFGERVARGELA